VSLFELQAGGARRPVFFFPGGGGSEPEFFVYARLARSVGAEYPFYGLCARGADGVAPPHRRVEAMAADYIGEMQARQPHGPYVLVGECLGGIVAYEVACQLQARGELVALLVLMDTPRPTKRLYWQYRLGQWRAADGHGLTSRLGVHWHTLQRLPPGRWAPYIWRYGGKGVRALLAQLAPRTPAQSSTDAVLAAALPPLTLEPIAKARARYCRTLCWHRPRPYDGPIHMLVNETYYRHDPTLGWDTLARGGLHLHKVPGNHDTYIREYAQMTAQALHACLETTADADKPGRAESL